MKPIKYLLVGITILCLFTGCDKIISNGNNTDTNGIIFNTNSFSDYVPWWIFGGKTNNTVTNNVITNNIAAISWLEVRR